VANIKYSILVNCTTGGGNIANGGSRSGGFSESYWNATELSKDSPILQNVLNKRAAMLPNTAAIVGYRMSDADKGFRTRVERVHKPGTWAANDADLPSMALQFMQNADTGAVLRPILRGIPDSLVVAGEYREGVAFQKAYREFFEALNGWYTRTRAGAGGGIDVISITAEGVLTTAADVVGAALGGIVTLTRPSAAIRGRFGGNYKISAFTNLRSFTLQSWAGGAATKGKVRALGFVNSNYDAARIKVVQAINRKCGRPFFQFSGKGSR